MKRIETTDVAEELVSIFSRVGVPEEMLSDRWAQFTAELMQEISRLLSLKQLFTTPYHAMCNGQVERFNGTLKSMVKKMTIEKPRDWDRYIPAVLFAYREVPQESLGFSPFELLYGEHFEAQCQYCGRSGPQRNNIKRTRQPTSMSWSCGRDLRKPVS